MGWVRIDDGFPQHPKVAKAGPLGIAMQVAALCYCNRYLTDGFIPRGVVPGLLNLEGIAVHTWDGELFGGGEDATWQLVVADLIEAGLWEEVEGGYRIHDYLDYQPSRQQVLAERQKTAERVRRHRAKEAERNADVTPLHSRYNGVSNTTPNPNPKSTNVIEDCTVRDRELSGLEGGTGETTLPPSPPDATPTELALLHELKAVDGYPFDYEKDLAYVRTLLVDFADLDLMDEVKKWSTYKRDKPLGKNSNPRLQLRNWLTKAREFARERRAKDGRNRGTREPPPGKGKYDDLVIRDPDLPLP